MDSNHFDDMVRTAANRGSRRGVLFALTGGLLTALIPFAGSGKNKNKKKKGKKGKKHCTERCGGRCVSKCPDIMTRNRVSCQCQCPEDMQRCGQVCVGDDRCCPGEKECGGGCIHKDECCPHDEECCPDPEKTCADGRCVPQGACCPGAEVACRSEPRGCCIAGLEECAKDGCCPLVDGQMVCDDTCVNSQTDRRHCGGCNAACAGGESCVNGKCGEETCPFPQKKCGDKCCAFGEDCCHGVCAPQGTAACTNDGWCPFTPGNQPCGVPADDGPCCLFSAGEVCCVTHLDPIETTCCPVDGLCAPGGCCPAGTRWKGDCDACCTNGVTGCQACQAPVPGRG